ncbi:MAG: chemotaxis protein CheA, partial [Clostridiales bacterium]|nr:chemotaxis protein CheA [Clostridiales bacterium]
MPNSIQDPMLEMFIFETAQLLEQLEGIILKNEKQNAYPKEDINEIFRIMHTIKGSSAMMMFDSISTLSHHMEDLFFFIREEKTNRIDFAGLTDLVLKGADYIKAELPKLEKGEDPNTDCSWIISEIEGFLKALKEMDLPLKEQDGSGRTSYKAVIFFEEGCQMENIRAFSVVHNLKDMAADIRYFPPDIADNNETNEVIQQEGFTIWFRSEHPLETMREILMQTAFLRHLELEEVQEPHKDGQGELIKNDLQEADSAEKRMAEQAKKIEGQSKSINQSVISVSVNKLDTLMNLVGEMVIAESMVVQNPDLKDLDLDNFYKSARQLNKITNELQETVMSIRMVPLSATFHRMHRIVRDMSKKLDKEVKLEVIGEGTEVDKNIIEHISDPLMHLIRNSIDHGIELREERLEKGKPENGTITLEAKNAGNDVIIVVKDDGRGLDRKSILEKAEAKGILQRPKEDMSDKEVWNLILLPGFSTEDTVSEYSGRGVGMDVVARNIETIGGTVSVDNSPGKGMTITLKIPLTLAIIDGMNIRVGQACYTLPTASIREFFRPREKDVIIESGTNELIMVRGQCYPIIRLHQLYGIDTSITELIEGIIIMVEQEGKTF